MNKSINVYNLRGISLVAFTVFNIVTLLSLTFSTSAMASTTAITVGMSSEVAAEFNKQLNKQVFPKMSSRLSMMKSPYRKFLKDTNKKIGDKADKEYDSNHHRRLMTHDESVIKAESRRFRNCQRKIVLFIGFSSRAKAFFSELTKEKIMKGNTFGVDYPFTQEQGNDAKYRPSQVALELGWQYQGQGEEQVEVFFKSCLATPISLYYEADKF